ncbi:MAG: carbamoyl-phosphate synthase large subunit, partial [Firmicutes bacterium]|nr:carbamoyl-phosphate synthase large subunit [Bacillota bacterium]
AAYLKQHGIRTHAVKKISDGSKEILEAMRQGYVNYVINTRDMNSSDVLSDGHQIRQCAVENNVTTFTSLDTVKVLLDVLEETTLGISTIDA